jgi:hypothetical protein
MSAGPLAAAAPSHAHPRPLHSSRLLPSQIKAACEHNQIAVNHLLKLLHLSSFGSQRYKATIHRAVRSLCLYPLPIESERDALSLDGVGKFLACEIMKAFQVSLSLVTSLETESFARGDALYKPEHGRGPWAVMSALSLLNGRAKKEEILSCLATNSIEVCASASASSPDLLPSPSSDASSWSLGRWMEPSGRLVSALFGRKESSARATVALHRTSSSSPPSAEKESLC